MIKKSTKISSDLHLIQSGAIAVERFCKEREIPGRLIPVPREISASCGLSWAVLQEEKDCLELVEREFAEEIEGKWMLDV